MHISHSKSLSLWDLLIPNAHSSPYLWLRLVGCLPNPLPLSPLHTANVPAVLCNRMVYAQVQANGMWAEMMYSTSKSSPSKPPRRVPLPVPCPPCCSACCMWLTGATWMSTGKMKDFHHLSGLLNLPPPPYLTHLWQDFTGVGTKLLLC